MSNKKLAEISQAASRIGEIASRLNDIANEEYLRLCASSPPIGSHDAPVDLTEKSKMDDVLTPYTPKAAQIRKTIAQRQMRARFFDDSLFSDPAWDMLLDLAAAHIENVNVSVTSLCIASAVPSTTALRWINRMIEVGLFQRVEDKSDGRRSFIGLTDKGMSAITHYFEALEKQDQSLTCIRKWRATPLRRARPE